MRACRGRKRLDDFCAYTAVNGIHEYCSPTYTSVDLACLHRLHTYCVTPAVREQCEALLKVFWLDAIANCFAPSFRLGGAHSRDYDYLCGCGGVEAWLAAAGCFASPNPNATPPLLWLQSSWRPPADWLRDLQVVPRVMTQVWGPSGSEYRVMWAGRHVALSIAGKTYHNMDAPMVVNFAGPQTMPRGYFIADGRRDPYGKKVIRRVPARTGRPFISCLTGMQFRTVKMRLAWHCIDGRTAGTTRLSNPILCCLIRAMNCSSVIAP